MNRGALLIPTHYVASSRVGSANHRRMSARVDYLSSHCPGQRHYAEMRALILILLLAATPLHAFPVKRCINLGNALEAPREGDWG